MKKIAVIGSGISGMTCAHLLAPHHDVHLFESASRLGGHTNTVEVKTASGSYQIDTGFIVFNDRNYPNFVQLLNNLGIKSRDSIMSFSVKSEKNGLEYNGNNLNSLFCQRRNLFNPSFYRMIKDIVRFNKEATRHYITYKDFPDTEETLEEYVKKNNYSEEFIETYIMPMGAAIWSVGRDEMKKFPLSFFVRFFHHHGLLTIDDRPQWKTIVGGSKNYIPAITKNFEKNIHLNSPIICSRRVDNGVELEIMENGSLHTHFFDEVIFSSHANQTMEMIKDPTELEKSVMGGFSYRPNTATLHTDKSILPKRSLGHASWNYYLPELMKERVAVTYHMNILQGIKSPETFLVSLNLENYIDTSKIIQEIQYSHPVYTVDAMRSQKQWDQISGKSHVHFCGAYWGNGFHEDGVKSALKVASHFGVKL